VLLDVMVSGGGLESRVDIAVCLEAGEEPEKGRATDPGAGARRESETKSHA
jgi:hypothetical protein